MKIVILTGSGISAESGIETFRADTGMWMQHDVLEVATPEAYEKDPEKVLNFYNQRREDSDAALPNDAHIALAKLQESDNDVFLVTQNVDNLHERAGSSQVCHMHGSLGNARCTSCETITRANLQMTLTDQCPVCYEKTLRPDIVWFGEIPKHMEDIRKKLKHCDLFIAVGTSGTVYPAADFVRVARQYGANTMEFNTASTDTTSRFREHIKGPAGRTIPKFVNDILMKEIV